MDRLKKGRRPYRTQVTKFINEINAELTNDPPDRNKLTISLDLLKRARDTLIEWDENVKGQLLDDDVEDDVMDREFQEIQEYDRKFYTVKQLLEPILEAPLEPPGSPSPSEFSSARSQSGKKKTYKLPKVELCKFGGEIREWLGFWSQFQKIDDDEDLHDADKFQYLVQAMEVGSRAKELVCSYPQSADNYPKVIKALKDRFGKEELLVEVYVRELLKLVVQNASSSKEQFDLSRLFDQLESHLRALESLGMTSEKYDAMIFPMVESCLPVPVLRAWQRSHGWKTDGMTKLQTLMKFLEAEVEGEQRISLAREGFGVKGEAVPSKAKDSKKSSKMRSGTSEIPTAIGLHSGDTGKSGCGFCLKRHPTQDCFAARKWDIAERKETLKKNGRCYKCLLEGHMSKACKFPVKCIICDKSHYAIICPVSNKDKTEGETKTDDNGEDTSSLSNQNCTRDVVLQTLQVKLTGANGQWKRVRAMLDTGSQHSYILEKLAKELKIQSSGEVTFSHSLFGGGTLSNQRHQRFKIHLESVAGSYKCNFDAYNQESICGRLPCPSNPAWKEELQRQRIQVSDFGSGSAEIHILIGADVIGKLFTGNIRQLSGGMTAVETRLGWTLMGKASSNTRSENLSMVVTSMMNNQSSVSDLWELEKIGIHDPCEKLSQQEEDEHVREHFRNSVFRGNDGRYEVGLPWMEGHPPLRSNRYIAEKRLRAATCKLNSQKMFGEYDAIFKEWQSLEIIEKVSNFNEISRCHYLPHRPVFKPDSATTKIRPVYDASCAGGTSGMLPESGSLPTRTADWAQARVSLNDCLAKGPNMLEIIPALLLRFREKPVAATADIRKAFLMISVREEDRDFLRFLWWEDSACQKMVVYRHNRVVFGLNCSPFLLGAVLEHHLNIAADDLKPTAMKLSQSLYVDNVVASFDNETTYKKFKEESTALLADAKFDLRLWQSNVELCTGSVSVLGVLWNCSSDTLHFDIPGDFLQSEIITKRTMLSVVAKIFDPLGMLAPVTLIPKMCLQDTWSSKLGWDHPVPEEVEKKFRSWVQELPWLNLVQIPRFAYTGSSCANNVSLHIFCDASTSGCGICIYLRNDNDGMLSVHLLMAKSRVAPCKKITVNRLELVACEIGARLAKMVTEALKMESIPHFYWTDSSTALSWIKRNENWGTFVGNRVRKILSMSRSEEWRHVPGLLNPADLPSRGCNARVLLESKWCEGPEWLRLPVREWPVGDYNTSENDIQREMKKTLATTFTMTKKEPMWYDPERCHVSKYGQLVRVMGYVGRFLNICRKVRTALSTLSVEEIEVGEKLLWKMVQTEALTQMQPFKLKVEKDSEGLYRVQTKLTMREDTEWFRSPVLLPSKHPVVEALIRQFHLENCHAGAQFLMANLREKVWILKGRKSIERVISRCVRCRRFKGKHPEPDVAPLPANRIKDSSIYDVIGIDLAGPLYLKDKSKAWVVLYTCAIYRAIHLELVTSLSAEAFLLSFRRFIAKNGRPSVVYTDNGTNFTGSQRLLSQLDWNKIQNQTTCKEIKWIFIVPSSPWWGGWWERIIRTVKELLLRMLGKSVLNYEELMTVLCDVQEVVNGRPLCYVFENDVVVPLTPAMFQHGVRNSGVADLDCLDKKAFQGRYRLRQRIMQDLRSRFRKEYLGLLVQRVKKTNDVEVKVGDVVLIGSDNKKRISWPIGAVIEVIPGRDGIPRVAKVKTGNGVLIRPFQRLYPLEVSGGEKEELLEVNVEKGESVNISRPVEVRTRSGRVVKKPERL